MCAIAPCTTTYLYKLAIVRTFVSVSPAKKELEIEGGRNESHCMDSLEGFQLICLIKNSYAFYLYQMTHF